MVDVNDSDFEWPRTYIQIVPRLTGSLSAVSSATIIYLILRSQTRLSSIYHQIMVCMSMFDISATLAMVLTTIPMPTEMPQEKELGFEWPGTRYGNHATCAAQGFFTLSGVVGMFAFNSTLCLYYACAVAFQMKEEKIRRYILPFIFGFPFATGYGFSTALLFADSYNPPTNLAIGYWCRATIYPSGCTEEDGNCLRGNYNAIQAAAKFIQPFQGLAVLIMVTSLVLVVHSRFRVSRLTKKIVIAAEQDNSANRFLMSSTHKARLERLDYDTRAILLQSLAYVAAFVLGNIWPFMSLDYNTTTFKLGLFFLPIQGFFNLIVFLSHKIHNYRRIHRESTRWQVVKLLFSKSIQEPCFVSRISMVADDDIQAREDDRVKLGLPLFRIMNEMDAGDCALDVAVVKKNEVIVSDRDSRGEDIEDPEDDKSENLVDCQRKRMKVSKNDSISSCGVPSRNFVAFKHDISSMSSSFQLSDEFSGVYRKSDMLDIKVRYSARQGMLVDSNDSNSQDQCSSNLQIMGMHSERKGPVAMDDVSKSGLSGFSSILRSVGSFAENDPQLNKNRGDV